MSEKAIAVKIQAHDESFEHIEEQIEELERLANTADIEVLETVIFKERPIVPATYLGKGRWEYLKELIGENQADLLLMDLKLSPVQVRNIEKILGVRVMERTQLILTIFIRHAKTKQAKLQVELAHLEYMLPRLTRMWTHLDRERGGIGLKGAGEKEIETDRRQIRNKIALLKKKLQKIQKQSATKRKQRHKIPRVAMVGYTNSGKSTLMNLLTKADVRAEDKLFATLDTTVRRVEFKDVKFLLSDTVGFIRDLPPTLVEAFKSTLAEAVEADILMLVVDISNPFYIEQIQIVQKILLELKAYDKPVLMVLNKIDKIPREELAELRKTWIFSEYKNIVFVSALKREGIELLRSNLIRMIRRLGK